MTRSPLAVVVGTTTCPGGTWNEPSCYAPGAADGFTAAGSWVGLRTAGGLLAGARGPMGSSLPA